LRAPLIKSGRGQMAIGKTGEKEAGVRPPTAEGGVYISRRKDQENKGREEIAVGSQVAFYFLRLDLEIRRKKTRKEKRKGTP